MTDHEERGEYQMGEDKNVFLTIMNDNRDDGDEELKIDFGIIAKHARRLLALWLTLAIALGSLCGGVALLLQKPLEDSVTKALVSSQNIYDITKVKSPSVVEAALNEMGLDVLDMEDFRDALEIGGVIPSGDYERLSMYYDLINKSASSTNLDSLRSLLDAGYSVSQYIVSFHYKDAKLSQRDGVTFLNALLRAYRDYSMKVYWNNLSMGNSLSVIDYREYDYAEAANIFSNTLNSVTSYLSSMEGVAGGFRSTETGLTFQDLRRTANLLRSIDLDRISSYIVIHSVSENDADTEVAYYRWRIEQLEQERNVQRTRFYSLEDSINSYQKDDILIINGVNGNSVVSSPTDVNANYDNMIQEKLDAEAAIASSTRSISYYESVIDGFEAADETSKPEDTAFVRESLESLNEKVNQLILNVSQTANEYYETVASTDLVQVLVPPTLESPPLITSTTLKLVIAVEALLFLAYVCLSFVAGIKEANPAKKEQSDEPKPQPVATV
ncbi:MAG: hypothetical protein IJT31_08995 [Oscillibacter sp.]|nr:hypothetical protein [Oscillibacter sp.]